MLGTGNSNIYIPKHLQCLLKKCDSFHDSSLRRELLWWKDSNLSSKLMGCSRILFLLTLVSLMAITVYYFFASFQSTLPWAVCDDSWAKGLCNGTAVNAALSNKTVSELYFEWVHPYPFNLTHYYLFKFLELKHSHSMLQLTMESDILIGS